MELLAFGFVTGVFFGFLLQKGQILRYDKQLGALRLLDFTIVKFMLSTTIVSMIGLYLLRDCGLINFNLKAIILGANIIGGLIFGVGWGLLGYCPGTSFGALGEGRWDSIFGIMGMLAGAALYAELYPVMKRTVLTWGNFGKIALPDVFDINYWFVIIIITCAIVILFIWFEKKKI